MQVMGCREMRYAFLICWWRKNLRLINWCYFWIVKGVLSKQRAIKPWAVHLTPLSVVSTDGKENNLTAWNCITADLRHDTTTQPPGVRKAARAATCKTQFPHCILKILKTPRGVGLQLLLRVHTEPPPVICSGLDSMRAPTDGSRKPRGKENNANVMCKKNSKTIKNSVAADSFYWSVCLLRPICQGRVFSFHCFGLKFCNWNQNLGVRHSTEGRDWCKGKKISLFSSVISPVKIFWPIFSHPSPHLWWCPKHFTGVADAPVCSISCRVNLSA